MADLALLCAIRAAGWLLTRKQRKQQKEDEEFREFLSKFPEDPRLESFAARFGLTEEALRIRKFQRRTRRQARALRRALAEDYKEVKPVLDDLVQFLGEFDTDSVAPVVESVVQADLGVSANGRDVMVSARASLAQPPLRQSRLPVALRRVPIKSIML